MNIIDIYLEEDPGYTTYRRTKGGYCCANNLQSRLNVLFLVIKDLKITFSPTLTKEDDHTGLNDDYTLTNGIEILGKHNYIINYHEQSRKRDN